MSEPQGFTLRRLIPAVLVLGLVLDVGSRFVPYEAVAFRAWEALAGYPFVRRAWDAVTNRAPSHLGRFQPNRHYFNDHAYGDLGSIGNRPWLRQFHPETFTTDFLGFRNTAPADERHVAVVAGTSFTVGASLSDDETLPAQLSALIGGSVYNAGAAGDDDFHLDALLDRLNVAPGGTFILEYLERNDLPRLAANGGMTARLKRSLGNRYVELHDAYFEMDQWRSISPLLVVLTRARKLLENDVVLPNSYAPLIDLDRLGNGDPILFLPLDRCEDEQPERAADVGIPYWRHLADHLSGRGLRLMIVLVPTKYTVYGPLLDPPASSLTGPAYLGRVSAALQTAGIPNLDVTELLQDAARRGLPAHRYVYWRDDSHWNRDGVALVARAVAAKMKALGWAPAAP